MTIPPFDWRSASDPGAGGGVAMTIESIPLTADDARRLTERIRIRLDRVSTAWADLGEAITEAFQRRADLALGYGSWADYADAELKPAKGLAVEVRRQLVSMLSAAGMSTRAIAPAVGVKSDQTIRADLARQVRDDHAPLPDGVTDRAIRKSLQVGTRCPPEGSITAKGVADQSIQVMRTASPEPESGGNPLTTSPEPERIDRLTGEIVPAPTYRAVDVSDWTPEEIDDLDAEDAATEEAYLRATIPAPVKVTTGLDGKSYPRPEPTAPRRKALPEQFLTATLALTDRVAAITKLADDDRFSAHTEKVATANRSDLIRARDALQRVIDQLPERNLAVILGALPDVVATHLEESAA